jgi:hypothetical protein
VNILNDKFNKVSIISVLPDTQRITSSSISGPIISGPIVTLSLSLFSIVKIGLQQFS